MRSITLEERRTRLGARHHLASPGADVQAVTATLVGLHSSDPATVFLAARSRLRDFEAADLEAALYEHKTLVRMLGMRRTMFVVPVELASTMNVACTQAWVAGERKRLLGMLEAQGIAENGDVWLDRVIRNTLQALASRGEGTARELTDSVPELRHKLSFGQGRSWAGTVGVSTRVLFLLATEGRIVRTRPRGRWISSQYRWTTTEAWLGGPLDRVDPAVAKEDLAGRWLRTFGPGTVADLGWWTGWGIRETQAALDRLGAVEVDLDGRRGWLHHDDLDREVEAPPWAALLPGLDPTIMGWKERGWYLGDHRTHLFDRNGNAGPTVWWDGRVVGGWAQRENGEIAVRLLEDVGVEGASSVDAEAAAVEAWLDGLRVTPRFRTPLEKQLTA